MKVSVTIKILEYFNSKRRIKRLLNLILIELEMPTRLIKPHCIPGLCALLKSLWIADIMTKKDSLFIEDYLKDHRPAFTIPRHYWWEPIYKLDIRPGTNIITSNYYPDNVQLRIDFIKSLIANL